MGRHRRPSLAMMQHMMDLEASGPAEVNAAHVKAMRKLSMISMSDMPGSPPPPLVPKSMLASLSTPASPLQEDPATASPASRRASLTDPGRRPSLTQSVSRAAMKKAFEAFDTDGSGTIDTAEITTMIKKLKLDLSPAQVKQLMVDADPDGSGEIDFEEFHVALAKQLADGGDGASLAQVVGHASSTFGWLDTISFFQGLTQAVEAAPASEPATEPGMSKRKALSARVHMPRMKATQYAVAEDNHLTASQLRAEKAAAKQRDTDRRQRFLQGQHAKVLQNHLQAMERVEALEALQASKRSEGLQMRAELERKASRAQRRERELIERSHSSVFTARQRTQQTKAARVHTEREQAIAIGEAAKLARAERKEKTKVTVRREEQQAREYTAKVRYETRPEVRKEASAHFERQRKAVAEEGRQKAEHSRAEAHAKRMAYLDRANEMRSHVEKIHGRAKSARERLVEERRMEARMMRDGLEMERQRKFEVEAERWEGTKALHNEVKAWKDESTVDVSSMWPFW